MYMYIAVQYVGVWELEYIVQFHLKLVNHNLTFVLSLFGVSDI